jgi:hypothetical protein
LNVKAHHPGSLERLAPTWRSKAQRPQGDHRDRRRCENDADEHDGIDELLDRRPAMASTIHSTSVNADSSVNAVVATSLS